MVTKTASLSIQPKIAVSFPEPKIHGRLVTTKIVGVSFFDRQESISKVQTGDNVWLEHDTNNPFDPNAVVVTRNNCEKLGYLNRHLASNLVAYFDAYEKPVRGRVNIVTGSAYDGYQLGVVVSFKIPKLIDTQLRHAKHQFDGWED